MREQNMFLCLTDLLDQDLSAYEYFCTLDSNIQDILRRQEGDINSFEQLQHRVNLLRASNFGE